MHDDMQPDNNPMAHNAADEANNDREGAMAKADLYKLANYSLKLFKRMDDTTQLESWVQAKITKAADYIASVYHYLEYEMKFSEYGEHLANAEVMSESQKREILTKLTEAKSKIAELKKAQAEKLKKDKKEKKEVEEGFEANAKVGDTKKTQHGTLTKTATGVVHKREAKPEDDEDYVPPKKEKKTAMTGAERREQKAKDKEQDKESKAYEKKHPGSVKRYVDGKLVNESDKGDMDNDGKDEPDNKEYMDNKDAAIKKAMGKEKKVKEALKGGQKKLDVDGDKKIEKSDLAALRAGKKVDEASTCNETPKGESCPVHGMKECGMYEAGEPSAGMTKKEKSSTVKAAKAGKDIGKPGKNFGKVAAAAKKGGAKDPEAVAAAAMWKNKAKSLKESLEALAPKQEEVAEELEDLNLENLNPEDYQIEESQECETCHKDPCECDEEKNESLNESVEFDRMKQFLTRLNG